MSSFGRSRTIAGSVALAMLAGGLALVAGCNRKPKLVPAGADSLAVRSVDSMSVYVQDALDQWEAQDGAKAAPLTARIVLDDLRLHPDEPLTRARTFLDSLGLGAEVSGEGEVLAVNLFARSDPSGGSWPFLYWRDDAGTHLQPLQGAGMRLLDVNARPPAGGLGRAVAVLMARTSARGQSPVVYVWSQPAGVGGWKLVQSLGTDSLGTAGTAQFTAPDRDSVVLVARTYRPTPHFEECPTCPHLYHTRRFRWGPDGLAMIEERTEPSPYFTFVGLINSLMLADRDMAGRYVTDPSLVDAANGYAWGQAKGQWRIAPGTEPDARDMVIFRGNQEAYRVHFARRGDDWLVSGFEPTSRSVE